MGTLMFYSIKLKKLNNPSTFRFNISSYIHDMISFNHLSDRIKSDYAKTYYFVSYLI